MEHTENLENILAKDFLWVIGMKKTERPTPYSALKYRTHANKQQKEQFMIYDQKR